MIDQDGTNVIGGDHQSYLLKRSLLVISETDDLRSGSTGF